MRIAFHLLFLYSDYVSLDSLFLVAHTAYFHIPLMLFVLHIKMFDKQYYKKAFFIQSTRSLLLQTSSDINDPACDHLMTSR